MSHNVKVESDLSNYAKKSDIKKETGVDTLSLHYPCTNDSILKSQLWCEIFLWNLFLTQKLLLIIQFQMKKLKMKRKAR